MRQERRGGPGRAGIGIVALWLGLAGAVADAGAQPAEEPQTHSSAVRVAGKMPEADENVVFSGMATIDTTLIVAPPAAPVAEIAFDFSAVSARGERSGIAYRVDSPTSLQRRLTLGETIEVSFPYYPEGEPLAARSATASFRLLTSGKTSRAIVVGTARPGPAN
ncbi:MULTISPECIES: hypothetical protein [unclassified Cupriavidus]|uniref:hypothetical protein n=1 Tax=unclassified Cupriavidus TaxID=2640874 RepID=UPI003F900831